MRSNHSLTLKIKNIDHNPLLKKKPNPFHFESYQLREEKNRRKGELRKNYSFIQQIFQQAQYQALVISSISE